MRLLDSPLDLNSLHTVPSHWSSSVQLPNGSQFFPIWPRSSHLLPLSALLVFCQHFQVHTFGEPVSLLVPQSASLLITPSYPLLLGQEEPPWEVRGGERLWIIILLIFFISIRVNNFLKYMNMILWIFLIWKQCWESSHWHILLWQIYFFQIYYLLSSPLAAW